MNGWVIVFMPGEVVYDMYDETPFPKNSLKRRLVKGGLKTFLAAAQLWYWFRAA